jgi:hypothetical protein
MDDPPDYDQVVNVAVIEGGSKGTERIHSGVGIGKGGAYPPQEPGVGPSAPLLENNYAQDSSLNLTNALRDVRNAVKITEEPHPGYGELS